MNLRLLVYILLLSATVWAQVGRQRERLAGVEFPRGQCGF